MCILAVFDLFVLSYIQDVDISTRIQTVQYCLNIELL